MSRLKIRDNEKRFAEDIKKDEAFQITTDYNYRDDIDNSDIRRKNTIFSYKYGVDAGDDKELLNMLYTCDCTMLKGQNNEGVFCMNCDSVVKKKPTPVTKFGYIEMPFKCPTLLGISFIEECIGTAKFDLVVSGKVKVIKDLYDDLELLFDLYGKPDKVSKMSFVLRNRNVLFSRYIHVISAKLRFFNKIHIGKTAGLKKDKDDEENRNKKERTKSVSKIEAHSMNVEFVQLSTAVNNYNEAMSCGLGVHSHTEKFHIYRIIKNLYNVMIDEGFGSKKKISRDAVYAIRFPYTSIAVLTPLPDYAEMDTCTIPVDTYRACFQEDIKKILAEIYNKNPIEINKLCNLNKPMSRKDRELIKDTFKYIEHKYIYINRQPTIDWGSIGVLRVVEIREELVLRLNINRFDEFRADCDGDALMIVGITSPELRLAFYNALSPRSMIMNFDRTFNTKMGLKADKQALFFIAMGEDD